VDGQPVCDGDTNRIVETDDGELVLLLAACGSAWRARCDGTSFEFERDPEDLLRNPTVACFDDGVGCAWRFQDCRPECLEVPCDGSWHEGHEVTSMVCDRVR